MLSINWNVRVCVCVFVCSLLRYHLNLFLPPFPKVGCPKVLEIWNPWKKVVERSGLRCEHFCSKMVYNRSVEKSFLQIYFFNLFTFEVPIQSLFAPTSRNLISKILRDSESLGQTSEKKWSQIWTLLLKNGLQSPWQKKFLWFFFYLFTFEVLFKRLLPPFAKVGCPKFFEIRNVLNCRVKQFFYRFFVPLFTPFKLLCAPISQSLMSKLFGFFRILWEN